MQIEEFKKLKAESEARVLKVVKEELQIIKDAGVFVTRTEIHTMENKTMGNPSGDLSAHGFKFVVSI